MVLLCIDFRGAAGQLRGSLFIGRAFLTTTIDDGTTPTPKTATVFQRRC
jgi:hypothetical protein